jgi:hypothetical protein
VRARATARDPCASAAETALEARARKAVVARALGVGRAVTVAHSARSASRAPVLDRRVFHSAASRFQTWTQVSNLHVANKRSYQVLIAIAAFPDPQDPKSSRATTPGPMSTRTSFDGAACPTPTPYSDCTTTCIAGATGSGCARTSVACNTKTGCETPTAITTTITPVALGLQ